MTKKIAVLGTGFAALTAAKSLRKLDATITIILVGDKAEFVYLPSLIWIPSGIRQPDDLQVDLSRFLQRYKITFHSGHVTGMCDGGRTINTTNGDIACDGVIIATGGAFLKKLPGIEHAITPCEGVASAVAIKQRLETLQQGTIAIGFAGNPNEPSAMRGGPMFEFLFGIDTLLRKQQRRDKFHIVFFSPAPEPGKRLGPKAYKGLMSEMAKRNIETRFGKKLRGFTAKEVLTEDGEFAADLILFMPGMTGNNWFNNTELPRSAGGLVAVNNHGKVEGFDGVYVAGDSGSFPGPEWMPKQAHMADMQAESAAHNLLAELEGKLANRSAAPELMCIVDTNSQGMFVLRTIHRNIVLPPFWFMHWVKRVYEWWYLRQYR